MQEWYKVMLSYIERSLSNNAKIEVVEEKLPERYLGSPYLSDTGEVTGGIRGFQMLRKSAGLGCCSKKLESDDMNGSERFGITVLSFWNRE